MDCKIVVENAKLEPRGPDWPFILSFISCVWLLTCSVAGAKLLAMNLKFGSG